MTLVSRFPFLDWMRGLAVVLMIQCHTFNAYARPDVRESGTYVLTQFVGGMAAPLFLFMAGMTLAFGMESTARREPARMARWLAALKRGGYVLGVAYLFRLSNCIAMLPKPDWDELTKVDILNCMGISMILCSVVGIFDCKDRVRSALLLAAAIAAAAPLVANIAWGGTPTMVQEYLAPGHGQGRGRFPMFPNAAYVAFGIAAGSIVRTVQAQTFDRLMQWAVLIGFSLVFTGQYLSNIPYSIYTKSSFWSDSPTLVGMRCGIALLLTAGSYLWTEYGARPRWSWMQTLGKNSLMVYWIHVMLVYGDVIPGMKGVMSIPVTAFATVAVIALMVAMSAVRLWWKGRRAERWRMATSPAGKRAEAAG